MVDQKELPLNLVKLEEPQLTPIPVHEVPLLMHAGTYPIWEPKLPLLSTIVPGTVLPQQLCQIPPMEQVGNTDHFQLLWKPL